MNIPYHIAIVMDGNGRWALKRGLPRKAGHKEGANRIKGVVREAKMLGVKVLTLFAFSTENWSRPKSERESIFSYIKEHIVKDKDLLLKEGVRLRFFGRRDRLNNDLTDRMTEIEDITKKCSSITLNIALDYGGRWDITCAVKRIARDVLSKKISLDDINEKMVNEYVSLSDMPEPDLFIRTSGELRISNFIIWQLAYTELYFTKVLWPDFTGRVLAKAVKDYSKRKRRFGKTNV